MTSSVLIKLFGTLSSAINRAHFIILEAEVTTVWPRNEPAQAATYAAVIVHTFELSEVTRSIHDILLNFGSATQKHKRCAH